MKSVFSRPFLTLLFFLSFSTSHSEVHLTEDGVNIDYEVVGDGTPLVLLHSGMMSREDMRTQIDYLSNHFNVIAIDAREQGRSSHSVNRITYELMANDVVGVLDDLGISRAHVFGQSDGGITALMMAHLFPERLSKIAIHGAVFNFQAYPPEQRNRWLNISWDSQNEELSNPAGFPGMAIPHYLLGRDNLVGFEDHLQEMATMWATSPQLTQEDLQKIQTPTLVIVGDHYDISIPHTLEMHEALADSQLFVVPGATHFVHQEKPELLHRAILDFLKD